MLKSASSVMREPLREDTARDQGRSRGREEHSVYRQQRKIKWKKDTGPKAKEHRKGGANDQEEPPGSLLLTLDTWHNLTLPTQCSLYGVPLALSPAGGTPAFSYLYLDPQIPDAACEAPILGPMCATR